MLNLLFISDSPKIEKIKTLLQPVLKVIIDVVTDFDHGLKDVFEKRPTTVCIQDQIAGVTGESVARHIQMLLGNGAPTFILLSTGNGKAREIKGLYEYVIDLGKSEESIIDDINKTLKSLLGEEWEKIYIPPKPLPASARSTIAVPQNSREDADKLVDDLLSDLDSSNFSIVDDQPLSFFSPSVEKTDELSPFSAPNNLIETEKKAIITESVKSHTTTELVSEDQLQKIDKSDLNITSAPVPSSENVTTKSVKSNASKLGNEDLPQPSDPNLDAKPVDPISDNPILSNPIIPPLHEKENKNNVLIQEPQTQSKAVSPAADFKIIHNEPQPEEPIPEELLLAFEENYRSESSFSGRILAVAVVCVICVAGGWYFFKQKPQLVTSLNQKVIPNAVKKVTPVVPSIVPPVVPPVVVQVQKPAAVQPPPKPVTLSVLPNFIPKEGHDSKYAAKNPGWERYVGKQGEFRVFTDAGKTKAIQILASKGEKLSVEFINSVMSNFLGSTQYKIISTKIKSGVRVENGKVNDKGEILFYRKNGAVKAIVVSIN